MIDVVDLTQNLIRCASVTPEDAGAQAVLLEPLKSMGFEIFDLPFEGRGSYPVKNFFARLGAGTPHICYSGHTDVVPAGADIAWRYPPFEASIDNGVMYGRGTSDMKGANAAFVTAISKFLESHKDFKGSISVMITGDEEADAINGSQRILEWMKENNHIPDMCLVGESSNVKELGEEIKIGRRGAISGKLTVTGKQGHTAYQHLADNPLPRLAAMASALNDIEFDQGTEHFPPTNLELTTIDVGNKADNVIPAAGFLKFNVRFNTHWTTESLEQKIRDTLDTITKNYALEMEGNANPFITTPGPWTKNVFNIVKRHTNREPKLSTSGGTSDARFVAQYCPVVEFGLTNETIHQIDENLKIPDLHKLVEIYADIIENTIG
ncbi:MAG TPA: succinyl-diaminopimelate desuccinylase [Alphaproteobacteria bacterium]|nr:succinyl-diaminopimelate desuccinylase [Alphaproteobacteria bacterium]